jgi:hypothetical protein
MRRPREPAFFVAALFLGLLLAVLVVESMFRLMGHYRWTYAGVAAKEPTMHEPDPTLGWKNKEGKYVYPAYMEGGEDIHVTILADGSRLTGTRPGKGSGRLVFVGGSFVRGSAISDDETFPYKIQKRYPSIRVSNFGTGGYGTYQSLLLLERLFSHSPPIRTVLYGFATFHEARNVASFFWMRTLAHYSKRGLVGIPYATLAEGGQLVRHPPVIYSPWRLAQLFASVDSLQEALGRLGAKERVAIKRDVTQRLMLEMDGLCKQNKADFSVILLAMNRQDKEYYTGFLNRKKVTTIDCVRPLTPGMMVPGEDHPNGRLNTIWADCIAKAVGNSIAR